MIEDEVYLVLDGGLATELEARGHDLDDPLWSAKVLLEKPRAIAGLHLDYFLAGARCVITATYQASLQGFLQRGLSKEEAHRHWEQAVALACEARIQANRLAPVLQDRYVAASIGPYGAYLHDGSEYRGNYGLRLEQLIDFHAVRFEALAKSAADILACETIPCLLEAEALLRLLERHSDRRAWFSFSCKDGGHLCHGEPIEEAAALLGEHPQVAAIGVNCTAPKYVLQLVERLKVCTEKKIVVYPNSGETWNAISRSWTGHGDPDTFAQLAIQWRAAGANWIGGCCRTNPQHIRLLAQYL